MLDFMHPNLNVLHREFCEPWKISRMLLWDNKVSRRGSEVGMAFWGYDSVLGKEMEVDETGGQKL